MHRGKPCQALRISNLTTLVCINVCHQCMKATDCIQVRSDMLPFNQAPRQATWWQSPPMKTLNGKEMASWREACCQPCCLVPLFPSLQPPKSSSLCGGVEGVLPAMLHGQEGARLLSVLPCLS